MPLDVSVNHLARTLCAHQARSRALSRAADVLGVRPDRLIAGGESEVARRLRGVSVAKLGELAQALEATTPGEGSLDSVVEALMARPSNGSKLEEIERAIITHAVTVSDGNVSAAARLLNVDRKMLDRRWRKIQHGR